MPIALIPFLLLAVPVAEIVCFILVGGAIGVWWTLGMILVTAMIGTLLLRAQGLGLIARIQGEVNAGRVPARELVHGVMLLVAGVLLLTPGFITDTLGFLLFVPALRDAGWRTLREKVTVKAMGGFTRAGGAEPQRSRDGTIDLEDGDFRRVEDEPRDPPEGGPPRADSPWVERR